MSAKRKTAPLRAASNRTPEHLAAAHVHEVRQMLRQVDYALLPINNKTTRGLHVPTELAPSQRPGAMDAFALPSLIYGKRVWPRGVRQKESKP